MQESHNNYAFIDASNLFYGGEKSLGWKIDYKKLLDYLKRKYNVSKAFYYGGVRVDNFDYSKIEFDKEFPLQEVLKYLENRLTDKQLTQTRLGLINKYIQRIKFYLKLRSFGYILRLKPVKIFKSENGTYEEKANCDVDMAFDLMKYEDEYNEAVILSGDGDFAVILNYLVNQGKTVKVLARGKRTAKEIKRLVGSDFRDFEYLRYQIGYQK